MSTSRLSTKQERRFFDDLFSRVIPSRVVTIQRTESIADQFYFPELRTAPSKIPLAQPESGWPRVHIDIKDLDDIVARPELPKSWSLPDRGEKALITSDDTSLDMARKPAPGDGAYETFEEVDKYLTSLERYVDEVDDRQLAISEELDTLRLLYGKSYGLSKRTKELLDEVDDTLAWVFIRPINVEDLGKVYVVLRDHNQDYEMYPFACVKVPYHARALIESKGVTVEPVKFNDVLANSKERREYVATIAKRYQLPFSE